MTEIREVLPRTDITLEYTWNQEAVFKSLNDWRVEQQAIEESLDQVNTYKGQLAQGPGVLLDYWRVADALARRIERLYFFAAMSGAADGLNEEYKYMQAQATRIRARWAQLISFELPEVLAIGSAVIDKWLLECSELAPYAKRLRDIFRREKYIQSIEVEGLLGLIQEPFSASNAISDELTNTDFIFVPAIDTAGRSHPVTQGTIDSVLAQEDRVLRQAAWNGYADTYLQHKNTLAAAYTTSVRQNTMIAQVRGYSSVLEMKLFNAHLPLEVFDSLLGTFQSHVGVWQRYWDVKRRFLGYATFHPYDIWAPLTKTAPSVTWEQAVEWIGHGMAPLGSEYVSVFRDGCLAQRWVDRAINQGKRQGAFSYGAYDTAPYILMSYANDIGSLSTLAHELGHSMHSHYTRRRQPYMYSHYSMFVAEVASNFNQALTRAYLFEEKADDRDFQLVLIQEAMENFHRYLFIMPSLARFEFEVHQRVQEGKSVTASELSQILSEIYADGYGSSMNDDVLRTGITWAQFPHLFEPFYTFQYATGISAAHALAEAVLTGDENSRQAYLDFLSAGSAIDPIAALSLAGVDMMSAGPVEMAFVVLNKLIDRLETLIP